MFHVNDKYESKKCQAKSPENCKFYKGEDDARHYESVAEAQSFIESKLSVEHGETEKQVRYSFVKEFKKQEEKFNKDFDGIPNRFFNADLRGKIVDKDSDEVALNFRYMHTPRMNARLMTAVSSPADNKIPTEKAEKLLEEQGFKNIQEIENPKLLANWKAERAWKVELEDKTAIVIDGNSGTDIANYAFRSDNEYIKAYKYWTKLDLRKVAGNSRIQKKTGINLLHSSMKTESFVKEDEKLKEQTREIVEATKKMDDIPEEAKNQLILTAKRLNYDRQQTTTALLALEEAQIEGQNFIAQKKYIKDADNPSVATVWQEKKDTDDVRKDLIKNSKLKNYFKKLDLDNDVDPAEFASFEKDYLEVADKLPKFPKGMEPSLHIRKLGKHSGGNFHVHGLFNPNRNAVAIDIRTGKGSTVHELYHHYDLITKNNASLSPEFQKLSKTYDETLKVPAELSGKEQYYKTKTEQFSRFAEIWMHERKGVNNSLLNPAKFESFDYAPLQNNPEFKEEVFAFFDKLHKDDENS